MKRTRLTSGKRNSKRQLSFKNSTHLVLRLKENLPPLFDPRDRDLRKHIIRVACKNNIRIYRLVLNHTHMHGVLRLTNRESYVRFIREITAVMVRHFMSSIGLAGVVIKNIFSKRPFTRAVPWGRAYKILLKYMDKNEHESGVEQKHNLNFDYVNSLEDLQLRLLVP